MCTPRRNALPRDSTHRNASSPVEVPDLGRAVCFHSSRINRNAVRVTSCELSCWSPASLTMICARRVRACSGSSWKFGLKPCPDLVVQPLKLPERHGVEGCTCEDLADLGHRRKPTGSRRAFKALKGGRGGGPPATHSVGRVASGPDDHAAGRPGRNTSLGNRSRAMGTAKRPPRPQHLCRGAAPRPSGIWAGGATSSAGQCSSKRKGRPKPPRGKGKNKPPREKTLGGQGGDSAA